MRFACCGLRHNLQEATATEQAAAQAAAQNASTGGSTQSTARRTHGFSCVNRVHVHIFTQNASVIAENSIAPLVEMQRKLKPAQSMNRPLPLSIDCMNGRQTNLSASRATRCVAFTTILLRRRWIMSHLVVYWMANVAVRFVSMDCVAVDCRRDGF